MSAPTKPTTRSTPREWLAYAQDRTKYGVTDWAWYPALDDIDALPREADPRPLNYQPLPAPLFDRRTAALAACPTCEFVWILDEDGCGSIDLGETVCPHCRTFGAGPLYREAQPGEGRS